MSLPVRMLTGSQESYDSLTQKDYGTLYFTIDTFRIYKGNDLYSQGGMSIIPNRQIQNPLNGKIYYSIADDKIYVYFEDGWIKASDNDIIADSSVSSNRTWSAAKLSTLPTVIQVSTRYSLPNIPDDQEKGSLFLVTDEHKIYKFLSDTSTYQVFGSDYEDIKMIDGGVA